MSACGFLGTWEVVEYDPCQDNDFIHGIKFRLDATGDVTWFVPEELKSVPLFNCDTYDLNITPCSACLRFGEYAGHVLEFKCDQRKPKDSLLLSSEGLYTLRCKRVNDDISQHSHFIPFSLVIALEDGYFSDFVIKSSNNKEFKTHLLILNLIGHGINWKSANHPLSNLPEDVLGTILHFLYSECLPENLSDDTAKQVMSVASQNLFLSRLSTMCRLYLRNLNLKKQIICLVNDMHTYLDKLADHFGSKNSSYNEGLASNPDHLCLIVKQCIRDASVVIIKFIQFCDIFSKRKNELTKGEQQEIIRYAKSRFPIFLNQFQRFLQLLKNTFGSMNAFQKNEIAMYLVPEVESILELVTHLIVQIKNALERIIAFLDPEDLCTSKTSFGNVCTYFLYVKELTKLRNINENISFYLDILLSKRQKFNEMSNAQKVRSISRNLEQLIEELPILFLVRLEEVTATSDADSEWRDFKFCFQVGTSKVSKFLHKLVTHRDALQNVIVEICELVQRDAFNQSLQNLGILDANSCTSSIEDSSKSSEYTASSQNFFCKLNLVQSFCIPPKSTVSQLSKQLLKLLDNSTNTDMEFEIITSSDSESTDELNQPETISVIKAHRVVVASRCDWFRKALQSGMKEDIDKKIIIHDTNPTVFKVFLEYLYSGKLTPSMLTNEQLVDLLVLSDGFEVDFLKQACESGLEYTIDLENAIYLLSLADNYNAKSLKNACLEFIAQNEELTESEIFYELPLDLRTAIFDFVWTKPHPRKQAGFKVQLTTNSDIDSHFSRLKISNCSSSFDGNDETPVHEVTRLDRSIAQIRDIVGDGATREQLVQVILAADFDLCRAINYYYIKYS